MKDFQEREYPLQLRDEKFVSCFKSGSVFQAAPTVVSIPFLRSLKRLYGVHQKFQPTLKCHNSYFESKLKGK